MTPDLDQTLSLKAQLTDTVSPQLQKIERNATQARQTLQSMIDAIQGGQGTMGAAASKMSSGVEESTDKLKKNLGGVSQSFKETGEAATQSSKEIGSALQDAIYSKGADQKIGELEADLGKLNKTMTGMASSQRTVSGRARSISAIAHDSLNKKVIPAFQELHGTLDQYPDTLAKINSLEEDRMDMLDGRGGGGGDVLAGVADRSGGGGKLDGALRDIQLGMGDLAGAIQTMVMGQAGISMQERKANAVQIGGADMFEKLPYMVEQAADAGQTSMDNVAPIVDTLIELRGVTEANIGQLAGDFYSMEKAGFAAGTEIASLYDKMQRLGGVKGEEFTILADQVKYFSEESVLSSQEMFGVLKNAAEGMTMFSGEAAKAYRSSSLAAAAAASNMGLDENTGTNLASTLMDSAESMSRAQGLVNNAGLGVNVQELVSGGRIDELQDAIFAAMSDRFGDMDLTQPVAREAFRSMSGGLMSPDEFMRMQKSGGTTGAGTGSKSAVEMKEKGNLDAPGSVSESVEAIRSGFTEGLEKWGGTWDRLISRPSEKMMNTLGDVTNWGAGKADTGVDKVIEFDDEHGEILSNVGGIAGTLGAANVVSNVAGVGAQGLGMDRTAGVLAGNGVMGTVATLGVGGMIVKDGLKGRPGDEQVRAIDLVEGNEEQLAAMQEMFNNAGVSANAVRMVSRGDTEGLKEAIEEAAQKLQMKGELDTMPDLSALEEVTQTVQDFNAGDTSAYDTRSVFQKGVDGLMGVSDKLTGGIMDLSTKAAMRTYEKYAPEDGGPITHGDLAAGAAKDIIGNTPGMTMAKGGWGALKMAGHGMQKMDEWTNPVSLAKKFFSTGSSDRTLGEELQIQDAFTATKEDFSKKFEGAEFDPNNIEHQKFMNKSMQDNMPKGLLESMQGKETKGVVADVQSVLEEFRVANTDAKANPEEVMQTTLQTQMADSLRVIAEAAKKPQPVPPTVVRTENTAGVEAENTFREQPRR